MVFCCSAKDTLRTGSKKSFLNDSREKKRDRHIDKNRERDFHLKHTNQISHHLRQLKMIKIRIVHVFGIQYNQQLIMLLSVYLCSI